MIDIFITFAIFVVVALLMAVGVILNNKTISGSCGGLGNLGVEKACDCEETCETHQQTLYQIAEPEQKEK